MRDNPKNSPRNAGGAQRGKARSDRRGWLIALCVLIPPVGLAYMWAAQLLSMRGRVIASVACGMLLFVYSFAWFGDTAGMPRPLDFSPGAGSVYAPESVTPEPTMLPGATNLPYEVVIAPQGTNAYADPAATIDPGAFVPGDAMFTTSDTPSVPSGFVPTGGSGMVYTADNSLFYHSVPQCGDKSYATAISLEQAKGDGLAPCNNCGAPE